MYRFDKLKIITFIKLNTLGCSTGPLPRSRIGYLNPKATVRCLKIRRIETNYTLDGELGQMSTKRWLVRTYTGDGEDRPQMLGAVKVTSIGGNKF